VTVTESDRALLIDFLRGKLGTADIRPSEKLEDSLRELLAVVWGMAAYQLS
jgi:hypothetical protein